MNKRDTIDYLTLIGARLARIDGPKPWLLEFEGRSDPFLCASLRMVWVYVRMRAQDNFHQDLRAKRVVEEAKQNDRVRADAWHWFHAKDAPFPPSFHPPAGGRGAPPLPKRWRAQYVELMAPYKYPGRSIFSFALERHLETEFGWAVGPRTQSKAVRRTHASARISVVAVGARAGGTGWRDQAAQRVDRYLSDRGAQAALAPHDRAGA